MNALRKRRILSVFKYTWPFYIISAVIIGILLNVLFGVTHRTPRYKTFNLFVSGEVVDHKKLKSDILETYKDKELKAFSCTSVKYGEATYDTKLSVAGYNTCDVLIIPVSKLEKVKVSAFGLALQDELITSYYQGYSFFSQEEVKYGIKINKEKVSEYMTLPSEDCYMILSGKSPNLGIYSKTPNEEKNISLLVAKDWGM